MNENNMNLKITSNFFKDFTLPFLSVFKKSFGEQFTQNFQMNLVNVMPVASVQPFIKSDYHIRKRYYNVKENEFEFAVLYPNKLIASLSDIATGGSGDVGEVESVTELQINACQKSMNEAFKSVQVLFQDNYNKKLTEYKEAEAVEKEDENYENCLKSYDFIALFSAAFSEDISFSVPLLFNMTQIKNILVELKLILEEEKSETNPLNNIGLLKNAELDLVVELGCTRIPMIRALSLAPQSLVELDAKINDDVKIYANDVEVARGQVVAIGEYYGVKITKLVNKKEIRK